MARKLYPLGIQTFEEIIKRNLLYVDKTEYVYRLTHSSGKYFFLGRPRRFGKSLLVSTLHSYFSGKSELFNGLALSSIEKEWTEYPVLHFDMSGGKHMNKEQLEEYLSLRLEKEEAIWGITHPSRGANNRLVDLIDTAYEKSGKPVVVLVDEYDAPMLDVLHEKSQLDALRNTMRNFYSPLKMCDAKLRFVFLTGITKFSQVSIFSELNNIKDISMDDKYAGICGITLDEMLSQLSEDVDELSNVLHLTREETISKLKENYDGYHFSASSPDVFNPFSLLNCFEDKRFGTYWFSSGTPTYLINMMKRFDVMPSDITRVEADLSEFDTPTENMSTLMPLLYQSGYMTIKSYDPQFNFYTLDIPNKEVKIGLTKALIPSYVTSNTLATTNTARRIAQCISKRDMEGALRLLQSFLSTVPYCNHTHYEGHYQQVLFIIFSLLTDYLVDVEVHTPKGRVDIVLLSSTDLYLIEIKLNKDAHTALHQINLKEYDKRFALSNKPIMKVGINFNSATGNMDDWVIE